MKFEKGRICRDNAEIIMDVLKKEGPMTIRDITKAVSGCEVGDSRYSQYSRTISGILCTLIRKGHILNDKDHGKTLYSFASDLKEKKRSSRALKEGEHEVCGFTAHINEDGKIDRITKDGRTVIVYIPGDVSGRGIRTIIPMPITADRLRNGLRTGRFATEVPGQ